MTYLKIINATPGKNTTEMVLEAIQTNHNGMTIRELSKYLNRPISMIQICLKKLINSKQIYVRKNEINLSLIYYPNHKNL